MFENLNSLYVFQKIQKICLSFNLLYFKDDDQEPLEESDFDPLDPPFEAPETDASDGSDVNHEVPADEDEVCYFVT